MRYVVPQCATTIALIMILAAPATAQPPEGVDAVRVDSGLVSLYGNDLESPPHYLHIEVDGVHLNSVRVYPSLPDPNLGHKISSPVPHKAERDSLRHRVWARRMELQSQGATVEEIKNAVLDLYQSRPDIVQVTKVDEHNIWILWNGDKYESIYDYRTPLREYEPPPESDFKGELQYLRSILERNGLLLIAGSGTIQTIPKSMLQTALNEIAMIRGGLKPEKANWKDRVLDLKTAQRIANPFDLTKWRER